MNRITRAVKGWVATLGIRWAEWKKRKREKKAIKVEERGLKRDGRSYCRECGRPLGVPESVKRLFWKQGLNLEGLKIELTVPQVDRILESEPNLKIDPVTRMFVKNVLLHAGLMEPGAIPQWARRAN